MQAAIDEAIRRERAAITGSERVPARLRNDPLAWAEERLGVPRATLEWSMNRGYGDHRWDGDVDPLKQMMLAIKDWESCGVESATGTGKTFGAAVLCLWFLDVFENSRVVTIAPKEKQLELNLWKEVEKLFPRFKEFRPEAELQHLTLRMRKGKTEWGMLGFACGVGADEQVATRAAGFHAEHMLFVLEECPGIHLAIQAAVESTCTAPHNLRLALGNPDHQQDGLHMFCTSPGVKALRVSGYDHPNVVCEDPSIVPGAVSRESLDKRLAKYGEDHPIHLSRSRGVCPAQATDALIRQEWVEAAIARGKDPERVAKLKLERGGVPALGVDVANSVEGDKACLAKGRGAVLLECPAFQCADANALGRNEVQALAREAEMRPHHVGVDVVGVGAGTINELRRLGFHAVALNGGSQPIFRPREEETFLNLRAQMYWQLRGDLQHGRIALPDDADLLKELVTAKWGTRTGKIFIEAKEDIKKRLGGKSPDKADAVCYWNWVSQSKLGVSKGGSVASL